MATPNIVPRADSEGGIGTASKYWASAYIDLIYLGAGKIGRDADNLLDFSTDNVVTLRLSGADELVFNSSQIHPSANDGLGLGYGARGFSDLFLASGAVINFDNGNVTLTHSSNALTLADSDVLAFGTSSDFSIFHDGSNNYLQASGIGDIIIEQRNNDKDIVLQSDDGSGGVMTYLYLDGSATGYVRIPDNGVFALGDGADLLLYHDTSNSYINHQGTGNLIIQTNTDDGDILFQSDTGSGGVTTYLSLDGSVKRNILHQHTNAVDDMGIYVGTGLDFGMYHDGTHTYLTNDSGAGSNLYIRNATNDADVIFECDNGAGGLAAYLTLDGGAGVTVASKNFKFTDEIYLLFGNSSDLEIVHVSDHSYMINNTGNLYIKNNADDGDIVFQSDDGSGGVATYLTLDGSAKSLEISVPLNVGSATGTTEGGGIDASDAVSITVGEINGEIITNIFVDIGVGSIQSSSTNTGALGNGTDAAAYITQVTTAINGIVYKAELICVEAPAVASGANNLDIDLSANASSIASGSAVSGTPVCESAGSATLGRLIKNTAAITPDHYLYLAQSGTNAGVYNAGKFLIRLYGAKTTGL